MPGKLKAKIVAGRHLPVMDRASELTDAFVEVSGAFRGALFVLCLRLTRTCSCFQVKFGNTTFKTDVCPKSLNPQWNSEWFKFEVIAEPVRNSCVLKDDSISSFFCAAYLPG